MMFNVVYCMLFGTGVFRASWCIFIETKLMYLCRDEVGENVVVCGGEGR